MRILTVGSDRSLFEEDSPARLRIIQYGDVLGPMDIVVFTKKGFARQKISDNIELYPTNSKNKWRYIRDAYKIGKDIVAHLSENEKKELVVSCQDPFESGLVGYCIAHSKKLPLQLQIHTDLFSPYFKRESFLNLVRFFIARFLIPRARCLRVVSQRIRRGLLRFNIPAERIFVLPIWSPPIQISPQQHTLFTILMVSRLEREKRIEDGIRAFFMFIKSGGEGQLIIVGDGSYKSMLEKLTQDLGIRDKVSFTGWKKEVANYYALADVFLLTSSYEGWGIAAYDALALHIPVVMTDVGLAGEMVKDGEHGFVVPVGSVAKIAEDLLLLYRDPSLRLRLASGAGMSNYDFSEYLRRYRAALASCIRIASL